MKKDIWATGDPVNERKECCEYAVYMHRDVINPGSCLAICDRCLNRTIEPKAEKKIEDGLEKKIAQIVKMRADYGNELYTDREFERHLRELAYIARNI